MFNRRENRYEREDLHNYNFLNPIHVLKINDKYISNCVKKCSISGSVCVLGADYTVELFILSTLDGAEYIPDELKKPSSTFTFYDTYTAGLRTMHISRYSMKTNYSFSPDSKDLVGYSLKLELNDIDKDIDIKELFNNEELYNNNKSGDIVLKINDVEIGKAAINSLKALANHDGKIDLNL